MVIDPYRTRTAACADWYLPIHPGTDVALFNSIARAMLDEGAGTRSALELADALEFLGANLGTASGFDNSAIRLNVPVARLGDALPLMADVALRPTFPTADLERLRQERLTGLLQARDSPDAIAQRAFTRMVFGPTHRYGTSAVGTETSVRAIGLDDLRAFHRAFYQPTNAALVVTGDVEPLRAESIASELDELPLPYRFEVQALAHIRYEPLLEHIKRVGILIYTAK